MSTGAEKDAISASLSDIPIQATCGPTEEQINATDFSDRDSMVKLLPVYMQEAIALQKGGKKTLSKAINIEYFQLKTPFGDRVLIDDSSLIIEAGKRQCLYGQNSTGKTLMFSNMSAGTIKGWPKHINVHHCKELEPHELHDTVLGTVVNSHPLRNSLLACEKKLREVLEKETDEEKKDKIRENLDYVEFNLNSIRSQDAEERAKKCCEYWVSMMLVWHVHAPLYPEVFVCVSHYVWHSLLKPIYYYWTSQQIIWIFHPFFG